MKRSFRGSGLYLRGTSLVLLAALAGCGGPRTKPAAPPPAPARPEGGPPEKLSEYGLFRGDGASQEPAEGVIPYELNSALFSDYALKYRFVKLPAGRAAAYSRDGVFDFPVGTVIAKTFGYPQDARDPAQGRRLIETRILKREADGWVGLPYIWNKDQTEAVLEVAGDTIDVRWIHTDGQPRNVNYFVPNSNQCKGCHKEGDNVVPIGPRARHLNRDFTYASGVENQLVHWTKLGALTGAPAAADAPRLPAWDDPKSGSLEARARAYLEINCAHCHNSDGAARNTGLDLLASQTNPTAYGVMKAPVAAGRGTGRLDFDIVPGRPEKSILVFRMGSVDPGIVMPELGKRMVHDEGLALIREWIASMKDAGRPRGLSSVPVADRGPQAAASSTAPGTLPEGTIDGNRFGLEPATLWRGRPGDGSWWWQVEFAEPREVGAILQVQGDHEYALRNAPLRYVWQASTDGRHWEDLAETRTAHERRIIRVHRLAQARRVRGLRLAIASATGESPALREVEFLADPRGDVALPPLAIVVSTTGEKTVPGGGAVQFRRLAHACQGWETLQFQNVWLGDFAPDFLQAEPRPLAAFLSGNYIDWCQQDRSHWRGTADVLRSRSVPIWASCGGAQGLAILAETGVDQPWDCPQCRDPAHPRLPIYTHIAGSRKTKCGDYSGCVFERGPATIRRLKADPAFAGLPRDFPSMESHCGQIEWPPAGWELIATCGEGGKTRTQCLRLKDFPIYAAQFHIEMEGTPESSRRIMTNFLELCRQRQERERETSADARTGTRTPR